MIPLHDQIPYPYRLERRPSRDEREEDLPELRDEDGRTVAVIELFSTDIEH